MVWRGSWRPRSINDSMGWGMCARRANSCWLTPARMRASRTQLDASMAIWNTISVRLAPRVLYVERLASLRMDSGRVCSEDLAALKVGCLSNSSREARQCGT